MGASDVFTALKRWHRKGSSTASTGSATLDNESPTEPRSDKAAASSSHPPTSFRPSTSPSTTGLPSSATSHSSRASYIPRSSLDKPLPKHPHERAASPARQAAHHGSPPQEKTLSDLPIAREFTRQHPVALPSRQSAAVKESAPTPDATTISKATDATANEAPRKPIELQESQITERTTDTDVTVTHAQPVIHETVEPRSHEDVQQIITREIHNHHVIHRVLPVTETQVLPTKHYAPAGPNGSLVEIEPPPSSDRRGWTIVSNNPQQDTLQHPYPWKRQVSKRDEISYIGPDGVKRTETTWFHPAHLEEGAMLTAQSAPFDFGLPRGESEATFVTAMESEPTLQAGEPSIKRLVSQSRLNREAEAAVRGCAAASTITLPVRAAPSTG